VAIEAIRIEVDGQQEEFEGDQIVELLGPIQGSVSLNVRPLVRAARTRAQTATHYQAVFQSLAYALAEDAGFLLDELRPDAHPFLLGTEVDTLKEDILSPAPLDQVRIMLGHLTLARVPGSETRGYRGWAVEADPYHWFDDAHEAAYPEPDTEASDPYDRFRLGMLLSATSLKDNKQEAFWHVMQAEAQMRKIEDPAEQALSCMMLAGAMRYAYDYNLQLANMVESDRQIFANIDFVIDLDERS